MSWADLGMLLIVLSWGLNYVVTKIGVSHLAPVDFVFWRFVGTAIIMIPWMIRSYPRTRRDLIGICVMGLVGVSLYQFLFSTALHLTLSANVAFLFNVSPLLTLLWYRVVANKVVGRYMWWGALLALAGVALLAGASIRGGFLGDVFALAAASCWSSFALLTDHFRIGVRGFGQTGWLAVIGAIGMTPFASYEPVWRMGPATWLPLLYATVFVTILGLSLWQATVVRVGPARASLMLYVIPLVAAAAGWLFLGERLKPLEAVGALAILIGVAWADGRFRRRTLDDRQGKPA